MKSKTKKRPGPGRPRTPESEHVRHISIAFPDAWFGPAMKIAEQIGIPKPRTLSAKVLVLVYAGMMSKGVNPDNPVQPSS